MITDDQLIIIGSANINERSLSGTRDTEIGVCGYQPRHIGEASPHGEIHRFRKSLWREHFGDLEQNQLTSISTEKGLPRLENSPESLETVRAVAKVAERNWVQYNAPGIPTTDLKSHILPYPYHVSRNGSLAPLVKTGLFPDTNASIRGKMGFLVPDLLTS